MLDNKVIFVFYGLAVACFVLAAIEGGGRLGGRRAMAQVAFVPLGLALYVFPQMWNAAATGF